MKRQTIKRLVRLLLSFGRPLRGRFPIRSHTTSGHHRNGSIFRDSVPVQQTVGHGEEIASRALAPHAQPFCNVQHITEIHSA